MTLVVNLMVFAITLFEHLNVYFMETASLGS